MSDRYNRFATKLLAILSEQEKDPDDIDPQDIIDKANQGLDDDPEDGSEEGDEIDGEGGQEVGDEPVEPEPPDTFPATPEELYFTQIALDALFFDSDDIPTKDLIVFDIDRKQPMATINRIKEIIGCKSSVDNFRNQTDISPDSDSKLPGQNPTSQIVGDTTAQQIPLTHQNVLANLIVKALRMDPTRVPLQLDLSTSEVTQDTVRDIQKRIEGVIGEV